MVSPQIVFYRLLLAARYRLLLAAWPTQDGSDAFTGDYTVKGCYAYSSGTHANSAYYGTGGYGIRRHELLDRIGLRCFWDILFHPLRHSQISAQAHLFPQVPAQVHLRRPVRVQPHPHLSVCSAVQSCFSVSAHRWCSSQIQVFSQKPTSGAPAPAEEGGPALLPYACWPRQACAQGVAREEEQRPRRQGEGRGSVGARCEQHGLPSCRRCLQLG